MPEMVRNHGNETACAKTEDELTSLGEDIFSSASAPFGKDEFFGYG